jgi:hypothetical protein
VAGPDQRDIDELVRRLQDGKYPLVHIKEAAEVLAAAMPPEAGYQLALDYTISDHEQVRILGMSMMKALAPKLDAAKGFMAGARDAARLLEERAEEENRKSAVPDYSAIGEVIKVWLRQSRESRRSR